VSLKRHFSVIITSRSSPTTSTRHNCNIQRKCHLNVDETLSQLLMAVITALRTCLSAGDVPKQSRKCPQTLGKYKKRTSRRGFTTSWRRLNNVQVTHSDVIATSTDNTFKRLGDVIIIIIRRYNLHELNTFKRLTHNVNTTLKLYSRRPDNFSELLVC